MACINHWSYRHGMMKATNKQHCPFCWQGGPVWYTIQYHLPSRCWLGGTFPLNNQYKHHQTSKRRLIHSMISMIPAVNLSRPPRATRCARCATHHPPTQGRWSWCLCREPGDGSTLRYDGQKWTKCDSKTWEKFSDLSDFGKLREPQGGHCSLHIEIIMDDHHKL